MLAVRYDAREVEISDHTVSDVLKELEEFKLQYNKLKVITLVF